MLFLLLLRTGLAGLPIGVVPPPPMGGRTGEPGWVGTVPGVRLSVSKNPARGAPVALVIVPGRIVRLTVPDVA